MNTKQAGLCFGPKGVHGLIPLNADTLSPVGSRQPASERPGCDGSARAKRNAADGTAGEIARCGRVSRPCRATELPTAGHQGHRRVAAKAETLHGREALLCA